MTWFTKLHTTYHPQRPIVVTVSPPSPQITAEHVLLVTCVTILNFRNLEILIAESHSRSFVAMSQVAISKSALRKTVTQRLGDVPTDSVHRQCSQISADNPPAMTDRPRMQHRMPLSGCSSIPAIGARVVSVYFSPSQARRYRQGTLW